MCTRYFQYISVYFQFLILQINFESIKKKKKKMKQKFPGVKVVTLENEIKFLLVKANIKICLIMYNLYANYI